MIPLSFKVAFLSKATMAYPAHLRKVYFFRKGLATLESQELSRGFWNLDTGALPDFFKVPTGAERQVTWHQRQVIGSAAAGSDFVSISLCPVWAALVRRCSRRITQSATPSSTATERLSQCSC